MPFNQRNSLSFFSNINHNHSDKVYELSYLKPGKFIIFNNKHFDNLSKLTRHESEIDVERLLNLFSNLNYQIEEPILDKNSLQIRQHLNEFNKQDYSEYSSLIMFIMSHSDNSNQDTILASDHVNIHLNEFIDTFKDNISLKDKPKLFFIQASRFDSCCDQKEKEEEEENNISIENDFLFLYSNIKDYYCYKDPESGSWYIQTLCDVISTQKYDDILNILADVNCLISQRKYKMPKFESILTKRFYFYKQQQSLSKQYERIKQPSNKNYGKIKFLNGEYEGELMNKNKKNGNGILIYLDGDKYIGEFKNDKAHGNGTYYFASGNKYVGEFKNNLLNGNGTFYYVTGNKYIGKWKNSKQNGNGTLYYPNGNKYVGEFKDNKFNGNGTLYFSSGNKYVGEFKDGKPDGNGTLFYTNGDKYFGDFKNEKINGNGTFYSAN
jgi:hypothetical protein